MAEEQQDEEGDDEDGEEGKGIGAYGGRHGRCMLREREYGNGPTISHGGVRYNLHTLPEEDIAVIKNCLRQMTAGWRSDGGRGGALRSAQGRQAPAVAIADCWLGAPG